ncbi:hypothetical protein [Streptomyces globisporus]|uniref:hypothetical protein n=1 Tax=Streptomyces globisporus TaxID=1908 RepID=UPI003790B2FE
MLISARAYRSTPNDTTSKGFVRKSVKEVADLQLEAQSIAAVLRDGHAELEHVQKRARELSAEARKGNPDRSAGPDPGLLVSDGPNGTVKVVEAFCGVEGTSQRTKDLMQWYADTLTGLVAHAAEIDAAVTRALKRSHGGDPHNAGHATTPRSTRTSYPAPPSSPPSEAMRTRRSGPSCGGCGHR